MAANRTQLQNALHKPYDRLLFSREVLSPVFGSGFSVYSSLSPSVVLPNKSESTVIDQVGIYGKIRLDDAAEIICYEILLQPKVRIEQSKVAIQQYVRKLLTAGQGALINFVSPSTKNVWRLTLVAKDSDVTGSGVKEKITNAKRYTFLLGPSETCRTAAERFEALSTEKEITFQSLQDAFSVERLSKAFFDEYTLHYQNFCDYLQESNYRKSVFNIDFPNNATKEQKDKASKPIRDFVKKLLGRIVFLYFVQKKGWLGASDTDYTDGSGDFIRQLFTESGGDETFYSNWLTVLFFDTLNKKRANDDFIMPDGNTVKVPFLNGGLFDKEAFDEHVLTFPAKLFHHADYEDILLTVKNKGNARGFLDFLDAFNFTVYEDSPDDHTVAVDPEMLGHIFENLLEDNKDKGAFYTPKEIVHYMCQESLIEYLATGLQNEYTVYKELGNEQIELFGNEVRKGQLSLIEELGEKGLDREEVAYMVKQKDISKLTPKQLQSIDRLLDNVKICDPAIGSGAFPMGLLHEILSIKELIAYQTEKEWNPAEVKLNIIQNSIYGVDIEKGAVDIARLRFWLSLVIDEEKPKPLPNLDYKIVVGDSLISRFDGEVVEIDWDVKENTQTNMFGNENLINREQLLQTLTAKQRKYFDPTNENKKDLALEIRNHKIDILINQLELMVKREGRGLEQAPSKADYASNKKFVEACELYQKTQSWLKTIDKLNYLKQHPDEPFNHFDWKLDFPEVLNPYLVPDESRRGFDIVIGNPPYIRVQMLTHDYIDLLKSIFTFAYKRLDISLLFFEKGLSLLKKKGLLCYISSNQFMFTEYGEKARLGISSKNLKRLLDFADSQVFENALTYTGIFLIQNDTNYITHYAKISTIGELVNPIFNEIDFLSYGNKFWKVGSSDNMYIVRKIEQNAHLIGEYIETHYGIISGKDELFLFDMDAELPLEDELMKPIITPESIEKWRIADPIYKILYTYKKGKDKTEILEIDNLKKHFPLTYKYLKRNEEDLKSRKDSRKSFGEKKDWYGLVRFSDIKIFEKEKIVTPTIVKQNKFAYDINSYAFAGGKTTVITSTKLNIKLILGLLNSKLSEFYFHQICPRKAGGYYNYSTSFILNFPLKDSFIENGKREYIIYFVDYILFLKQFKRLNSLDHLMPIYFEQLIDGMVYELYFPELFQNYGCEIIKFLGELPEFTESMSEEEKMEICKTIYGRLNDAAHPVRIHLEKMKEEIPEIRIIEGLEN
ncbi:MAG TPA: TaqI-like C-terminal specificity domain-containing protein [Dysgonamonadaceae bacterium]|nr:TaqI-like C-terminal specificity domain-containing protein [Dysgonamonadaceae bacterium]